MTIRSSHAISLMKLSFEDVCRGGGVSSLLPPASDSVGDVPNSIAGNLSLRSGFVNDFMRNMQINFGFHIPPPLLQWTTCAIGRGKSSILMIDYFVEVNKSSAAQLFEKKPPTMPGAKLFLCASKMP